MASLIRQDGLLINSQLQITFLMLSVNNYERAFEFVEVIIQNIVSFFTSDTVNTALFVAS